MSNPFHLMYYHTRTGKGGKGEINVIVFHYDLRWSMWNMDRNNLLPRQPIGVTASIGLLIESQVILCGHRV